MDQDDSQVAFMFIAIGTSLTLKFISMFSLTDLVQFFGGNGKGDFFSQCLRQFFNYSSYNFSYFI